MKTVAIALAFSASQPTAAAFVERKAFLGNGMQPEVVARTLAHVEDEWKAQAAVFADCDSTASLPGASLVNCADAPTSFGKSCSTVVSAIIQGSGGDKDAAKEYMNDVCSQHAITGWHRAQCDGLSLAVIGAMTSDQYRNREAFNTGKLCTGFWSRILTEEKQHIAKENADRETSEKKASEEAKEELTKQSEEANQQVERKKAQEAAHQQNEAAASAADAKAEVAESVAHVAEKKAEAEAAGAKRRVAQAALQAAEPHVLASTAPAAPVKAIKQATTEPVPVPTKDVVAPNKATVIATAKTVAAKPTVVATVKKA